MADTKLRPSQVFARRLRQIRKNRDFTQDELAHRLTRRGRPLSKAGLLRIERGERGLSLDEAFALAAELHVAPAHLLSPPDDQTVWLTDNYGLDGEEMRAWLLHGDKFIATASDYQRGELAKTLERVVLAHAQALVDAQRGDDKAGIRSQLAALGTVALAYQKALEQRGFKLDEEEQDGEEEQ